MATIRAALLGVVLFGLVACGGGTVSVLHTVGKPSGDGPAQLMVKNESGVTIHGLFIAKTEAVQKARAAGVAVETPIDESLWGEDQLGNAGLVTGSKMRLNPLPEGHYDILVTDPDKREQLVTALALRGGGKYVLHVGNDWTLARE